VRHVPGRIVSLSPSVTEILCALGLGRRLVGVDRWSDHPPWVGRLPKIGGIEVDPDAVAALEPDLVVACTSVPGRARDLERLGALGVRLTVAEPRGLEDVLTTFALVGEASGRSARAAVLIRDARSRMAAVADVTRKVAYRPRVYWEWWPKPLSAAAGHSWMTPLIEMAGGHNIFADEARSSLRPTEQEVWEHDPEVILLCWCGAKRPPRIAQVRERPGWKTTSAVRQGSVHAVPEGFFARPGPRLVLGLERLVALLHPELRPITGSAPADGAE
jgi:iron complex transport system substrate-binding protein